jgi:hypothetical protein
MADDTLQGLPDELRNTITKWAEITIHSLRQSMVNKYIGQSGDLYKSFQYKVFTDTNGNPTRVSIGFDYHGRFVDMGVGKGIKLENVKSNAEIWRYAAKNKRSKNPRRPKKWYSPTMYHEYQRAAEILAAKYGIEIPARFERMMTIKDTLQGF